MENENHLEKNKISIKDNFEFRRLLDKTKIYYCCFAGNGTHSEEFHLHQDELVKFIDRYIEEQGKESVELFKQSDEFILGRIS